VSISRDVAGHRPEAPAARVVLEILAVVGRPDENALPRELAGAAGIGEARAVLLPADERLDGADVGRWKPVSSGSSRIHAPCISSIIIFGSWKSPSSSANQLAAEHLDEGRFALALEALEDDGEVELVARLKDAGHGAAIIRRATLSV
jgi:hypothetical protein